MSTEFEGRYTPEVEREMRDFYDSLSEKDRRRYSAIEAAKLGHGGIIYIAEVLGCSRHTIERGREDIKGLPEDPAAGRVRRPGGGRKPLTEDEPELDDNLDELLRVRTAGDPMHPDVIWTDLSPSSISEELAALGTPASPSVVRDLLRERELGRRQIEKTLAGGSVPERNEQFEHIFALEELFAQENNPIFCMDTKKKERLGRLSRDGHVWTTAPQHAFDHDFPSWSEGVIIPHGIYDLQLNHGHINIGLSHDTSQFACESLTWFWEHWGRQHYPAATDILLECDAGGSNNCHHKIFKVDLQEAVNRIGLPIQVAHYPSYCSKYNPTDRRFFPHVTRACEGVLFDSLGTVVELMRKARTRSGLTTTVHVMRKAYEVGRQLASDALDKINLTWSKLLPQWNYIIDPQ